MSADLKTRSTPSSNAPLEIDRILWFQRASADEVDACRGVKTEVGL